MGICWENNFIYEESRKLITKDLVKLKELEFWPELHGDPPRYEFLWGPRARAEITSKRKLEVNATILGAFPSHYEKALREEEESLWNRCSQV